MNVIQMLQQISVLIGIWVAIYGIDAWRREHLGKRRLELAEDTLALFYEAIDAIRYIRHPASYRHETDGIERAEGETDAQFQARKNASIVFNRYSKYQELFNKIHASRYRFMAQVGKDESEPFNELRNIVDDIFLSARMLSSLWAKRQSYMLSESQLEEKEKQIEKYEAIFWEGITDTDPINQRITKVTLDIEKTCQSILSGKGTLHGFLNKNILSR